MPPLGACVVSCVSCGGMWMGKVAFVRLLSHNGKRDPPALRNFLWMVLVRLHGPPVPVACPGASAPFMQRRGQKKQHTLIGVFAQPLSLFLTLQPLCCPFK